MWQVGGQMWQVDVKRAATLVSPFTIYNLQLFLLFLFCFGFLKNTAQTSSRLSNSTGLTRRGKASLGAEGWKNHRIQFNLRGG